MTSVIIVAERIQYSHLLQNSCGMGWSVMAEYINKQQLLEKAEGIEIVRCKYCNHGHWYQEAYHGKPIYYCDRTDLQVGKYDFCSYGERRNT